MIDAYPSVPLAETRAAAGGVPRSGSRWSGSPRVAGIRHRLNGHTACCASWGLKMRKRCMSIGDAMMRRNKNAIRVSGPRRRNSGRKRAREREIDSLDPPPPACPWNPAPIHKGRGSGTPGRLKYVLLLDPATMTRPDEGTRAVPSQQPSSTCPTVHMHHLQRAILSTYVSPVPSNRAGRPELPLRGHLYNCNIAESSVETVAPLAVRSTDAASGLHAAVTEIATSANARYAAHPPRHHVAPTLSGDGSLLLLRMPCRPS